MKKGTQYPYRLVYRVDRLGAPCCYLPIEAHQAELLMKIMCSVQKHQRDMTVKELCKELGIHNKGLMQRSADRLAGVLFIERYDGNDYVRLCDNVVDVRKSRYNKRLNLSNVPPYLKPAIYFCSAQP